MERNALWYNNGMKSLREYIADAVARKVALGHFNISNIEGLSGIVLAAQSLSLPVIIGVSEGERDFLGVHQVVALVRSLRERSNYPVFLNADHTYSFARVKEAIDAGFDAVIFDGTKLSLEENIQETKKCVAYARACGRDVVVEGELGYIGQSSKLLDEVPEGVSEKNLTQPEDAARFVTQTGVDLLAPAVGNIHGMFRGGVDPALDISRVASVRDSCGVPLVLHGGSGNSADDFRSAIKNGVSIVHINTEIRVAFRDALKASLAEHPDEVAPYKLMKPAVEAIERVVQEKLRLFNDL